MSGEHVTETRGKQRVANALFVWYCHTCRVPIGVVLQRGVQVRYKGLVVEGNFPFVRKCVECKTVNRVSGPNRSLTDTIDNDTLTA